MHRSVWIALMVVAVCVQIIGFGFMGYEIVKAEGPLHRMDADLAAEDDANARMRNSIQGERGVNQTAFDQAKMAFDQASVDFWSANAEFHEHNALVWYGISVSVIGTTAVVLVRYFQRRRSDAEELAQVADLVGP